MPLLRLSTCIPNNQCVAYTCMYIYIYLAIVCLECWRLKKRTSDPVRPGCSLLLHSWAEGCRERPRQDGAHEERMTWQAQCAPQLPASSLRAPPPAVFSRSGTHPLPTSATLRSLSEAEHHPREGYLSVAADQSQTVGRRKNAYHSCWG